MVVLLLLIERKNCCNALVAIGATPDIAGYLPERAQCLMTRLRHEPENIKRARARLSFCSRSWACLNANNDNREFEPIRIREVSGEAYGHDAAQQRSSC